MSDSKPRVAALLVDAPEAARLLDLSERTFRRRAAAGLLPRPVRIGRSVRWSCVELEEWVAAGCPAQKKWDETKSQEER